MNNNDDWNQENWSQEGWDPEVGYGKPPRPSQFPQGRSGNSKGRPKGSKNTATLLRKALLQTVVVKADGRYRKITKLEAIIRQLVTNAALGDHRSIALMLDMTAGIDLFKSEKRQGGFTAEDADRVYGRLRDLVLNNK